MTPPRQVTLKEMVENMHASPDETVFRWYQRSVVNDRGEPTDDGVLFVTLGQARAELGVRR